MEISKELTRCSGRADKLQFVNEYLIAHSTSINIVLDHNMYTYNDYGEIASYTDYKENVTYYYNYDYCS